LEGRVLALGQEGEPVVDQGLVEEDTRALQEETTVTRDLLTSLKLHHVQTLHDLMVM
jgi:hypothetical protein